MTSTSWGRPVTANEQSRWLNSYDRTSWSWTSGCNLDGVEATGA